MGRCRGLRLVVGVGILEGCGQLVPPPQFVAMLMAHVGVILLRRSSLEPGCGLALCRGDQGGMPGGKTIQATAIAGPRQFYPLRFVGVQFLQFTGSIHQDFVGHNPVMDPVLQGGAQGLASCLH